MKPISRPAAALLALSMGMTGVAQADPLNIWSASRQTEVSTPSVEQVQHRRHYRHRHYRHRDGISPGAAAAIGIGAVAAGAMIAAGRNDRYYDDGYYYDEGPAYYEGRSSYCDNSNRPSHYPAPAGC